MWGKRLWGKRMWGKRMWGKRVLRATRLCIALARISLSCLTLMHGMRRGCGHNFFEI